MKEYV